MNTQDNQWGIEVPPLNKAVLDALNDKFPERCPGVNESEREIWMYAGRRALVRWLLDQYERQQAQAHSDQSVFGLPPQWEVRR